MIYTGIGSRSTPEQVLRSMWAFARYMGGRGHTLRSGGAKGADTAFELGSDDVKGHKQIFLPYRNFNKNKSRFHGSNKAARTIAKKYHPNWAVLGNVGRDFMARNAYQILGADLKTTTSFVICWTPNGKVTGGTGQALRMAEAFEIPVFNLAILSRDEADSQITKFIDEFGTKKGKIK